MHVLVSCRCLILTRVRQSFNLKCQCYIDVMKSFLPRHFVFSASRVILWNACSFNSVIYLVSMQVYSQPLFANAENWFRFKFPDSEFVNNTYTLKLPLLPAFDLSFLSLSFRTAYVASTTVIAMIFPYFNQILGVLGSISFWPLTIYFPVEIYLSRSETDAWTAKWVMLQTFNIFGFVFGLFTLIGCIRGIVTEKLG